MCGIFGQCRFNDYAFDVIKRDAELFCGRVRLCGMEQ
jgi:hypothetical protein